MYQRDELGLGKQVPQLGVDVPVVDVHRDRPQLVARQERLDQLDRIAAVDADMVPGTDAHGGQIVGELVAACLKLAIGDLGIAAGNGQALGNRVGCVLE